ncbi:protein of unknown function [Candidatus Filomicrobium marinum]|uniref:Uncharacterized protein n=1 Tax=Candidatus Filomicrobium marinum TaxID=1608628 RepID=A0A0D6JGF5_9HYPH|nr:protein of unknown function [Candidatus Filomicrobium marinum]CPR19430.1 protein of unknown function [Candidatus Filomicrobium marinum]
MPGRTVQHGFYRAVISVSHPSAEAQRQGSSLDTSAKAHSLHAALNANMHGAGFAYGSRSLRLSHRHQRCQPGRKAGPL